jgi:hypothetical protein
MPSVVEDFAFIAQRANEIRVARAHEWGISPLGSTEQRPPAEQPAAAPTGTAGFRYARGFEHLANQSPQIDDRGCCLSAAQERSRLYRDCLGA